MMLSLSMMLARDLLLQGVGQSDVWLDLVSIIVCYESILLFIDKKKIQEWIPLAREVEIDAADQLMVVLKVDSGCGRSNWQYRADFDSLGALFSFILHKSFTF